MTATRVRRARPSATRRRLPPVPVEAMAHAYRRARAAVGFAVFSLIFSVLWLINGSFTAAGVMQVFHVSVEWGWAAHFAVTALELTPLFIVPFMGDVPRPLVVVLLLISLPFGIFDVWSSAIGVAPAFMWTGASGLMAHLQNTVLAEIIAFLPEPMVLWLTVGLHNVLRS